MRVLSILTYYHPHWTGLTTIARNIAEGLAARGHEITVLTTRHDPALAPSEIVSGVRVVRLDPLAFVSRGAIVPSFPWRAAALMRDHDLVQIHTPLAEALLVAALCRISRRPLLMSHCGDLVMPAGLANRIVERTVVSQMSGAARAARQITALSADYARHSVFLGPFASKVRAIDPPVDLPPPDLTAAAAWRRGLGLEQKHLVGFAGRFVEEKGFDQLLEAVPALVAADPAIHLIYAGEHRIAYEQFHERCRPLLDRHRDRVTFVGLLRDPHRLANFYALCDVFALPSRTDSFAMVQVEAMLSGTPVVATDIPGAREVVQRTGMGRLARPGDPAGLAAAILAVLRERGRFVKARECVRAVYNPERSISEYEQLMQSIVARS